MSVNSPPLISQPRLQQSINEHNFPELVEVSRGASSSHTPTAGTRTEAHSWEGGREGEPGVNAA